MNKLFYVAYGQGRHRHEAVYSILSAIRLDGLPPAAGYEIVVYTDDPTPYAGLPVTIRLMTPDEIRDWAGPKAFGLRRKVVALADAMRTSTGHTLLIDTDTCFLRPPRVLFDRISRGQTLMHLREGKILDLWAFGKDRARFAGKSFAVGDGPPYVIGPETPSFNSGIVGLRASQAALLPEVLALTDAVHDVVPGHFSEQFAFTFVLGRHATVSFCKDVVLHYHKGFPAPGFREGLPDLLARTAHLPPLERAAAVGAVRPVPPVVKTVRAAIKRQLKPLGFFRQDAETSV